MRCRNVRDPGIGQSRRSKLAFVLILAGLLLPRAVLAQAPSPLVQGVGPIEITVSDADRAVKFYSEVLSFEKVSDQNVHDANYLRLEGASASDVRAVRMRLGDEYVELVQFAGTQGRPVPADSRSNDRWFQHIAIVVSDMGRAYERLRDAHVEQISSGPQRLPTGMSMPPASKPSTSEIPTATRWSSSTSRPTKGSRSGMPLRTSCSSA